MPSRRSASPDRRKSLTDLLISFAIAIPVLVAATVLFGPLLFFAIDQARHPLQRDDARYDHFFIIPDDHRDLFVLLSKERIFTFDVRTGEEIARGKVACPGNDEKPSWFVPDGPRIWARCGERSGLLVDLRTAQVVLDTDRLGGRHSELALGVRVDQGHVSHDASAPTRALPVTLHDGRSAFIDAEGELLFARPPTPPWRPGYHCWPEHWCSTVRRECLGFAPSADGHGMRLVTNHRHGERQRDPTPIAGWPTGLLKPGLVGDPGSRCAFEHEDTYLAVHDSAAFDPKETLLSLIGRDGTRRWTVPIAALGVAEPLGPRVAQRIGDDVLIVSTNRRSRDWLAIAVLDLATGEVRASHRLVGREL